MWPKAFEAWSAFKPPNGIASWDTAIDQSNAFLSIVV
jgi:hypothetical protein